MKSEGARMFAENNKKEKRRGKEREVVLIWLSHPGNSGKEQLRKHRLQRKWLAPVMTKKLVTLSFMCVTEHPNRWWCNKANSKNPASTFFFFGHSGCCYAILRAQGCRHCVHEGKRVESEERQRNKLLSSYSIARDLLVPAIKLKKDTKSTLSGRGGNAWTAI